MPQGYSPTVPIRDEGYGQFEYEQASTRPFAAPRVPRSRSFIAVVAVLGVTCGAGLIGAKLTIDPKTEKITEAADADKAKANAMLFHEYRKGFEIPKSFT